MPDHQLLGDSRSEFCAPARRGALLLLAGVGCEEGPAERAGRDRRGRREAGDNLRELAGEEALERAGREADEMVDMMKKAIEDR